MTSTIHLADSDRNFRFCDDIKQLSDVSTRHDDQDAWSSLLLDSDSIFDKSDPNLALDAITSSDNTLSIDNLSFNFFDDQTTKNNIQNNEDESNHLIENTPLQVDSTGTQVIDLDSNSTWSNPSQLPRKSSSSMAISMSSIVTNEYSSSPAKATVAAAAITAAMIIVPDEDSNKRPRSFSYEQDNINKTQHTVDTMTDDPLSPTSISIAHSDNLIKSNDFKFITQDETTIISRSPRNDLTKQSSRVSSSMLPNISHKTSSLGETKTDASVTKKRRAEAMERLRQKKALRKGGKRVRYQIRKRIATTRPRVNGRFARRCDTQDKIVSQSKTKC